MTNPRNALSSVESSALNDKLAPHQTGFWFDGGTVKRKEVMEALTVYLTLEELQHMGVISFKEYLAVGTGEEGLHVEKKMAARALKAYAERLEPTPGDTKMGTLRIAHSRIVRDPEFSDPRRRATVEATLNECWDGVDKWQK